MSTDGSKDKARGFAGLADLAPPPSPPPPVPPLASNHQEREPSALNPQPETQSAPKKTKDASKALWIIAAVAFAAILIYSANSANNVGSAPASSASAYQPPASSPPAPAYAPTTETTAVPTPAYSPEPVVESLPPQGAGLLLNDSQIGYCIAQKMRLSTWRSVTQVTNSADIDRFNAQVNDYNSRCSSYRYQQGAQERVAGEMENERPRIESMARASWLATTPPAPAPAPAYIPDLSGHYDTPAPAYPPIVPTPSTSGDDGDSDNGDGNNGNSGSDGSGNGNE